MNRREGHFGVAMEEGPSPPSPRRRWLSLLLDVVIMVLMFGLDVRDLVFKTRWIGPDDSYSFVAVGSQTLQRDLSLATVARPSPLNRSVIQEGDAWPRASGWGSFLAVCDDVHPIDSQGFFLHALGTNCTVGPRANGVIIAQLVMASAMRADAIAWAACKLLRSDRKPVICRSPIVHGLPDRYAIAETPAKITFATRKSSSYERVVFTETSRPVAMPDTKEEAELLHVLGIISQSPPPLSRLTCVEGFAYEGPGNYVSHLYGCGSAARFEAAFVGHYASDYASLQQDKAFLTADALHLMGMQFLIRQNSFSLFTVTATTSAWTLVHKTLVNFSSSGMLYTFAIALDVGILLISAASTIEIAKLVFWPLVQELWLRDGQARVGTAEAPFAFEDYKTVLTCPLFRSAPLASLQLLSQSLCWMLVIPNAIVWTWTEATDGRVQAYLSTLRVWVIPLILVNIVWNVFVYFAERTAYALSARAYVSPCETGAITCFIAFMQRARIFAISGTKYAYDSQRVHDATSFQGLLGFGNGFAESEDTLQTTPWDHFVIIYGPLGSILAWSFLGIALVVLVRLVYHTWRQTPVVMHHHIGGGTRRRVSVAPRESQPPQTQAVPPAHQYKRLPIEMLLNLPIRARSLVRSTYFMETAMRNKRFLRPSCYVEHGIVMEHHKLRTRRGFFGTIRYSTDAESHAMPSTGESEDHQHDTSAAEVHSFHHENPARRPTKAPEPPKAVRRRVLTPLR